MVKRLFFFLRLFRPKTKKQERCCTWDAPRILPPRNIMEATWIRVWPTQGITTASRWISFWLLLPKQGWYQSIDLGGMNVSIGLGGTKAETSNCEARNSSNCTTTYSLYLIEGKLWFSSISFMLITLLDNGQRWVIVVFACLKPCLYFVLCRELIFISTTDLSCLLKKCCSWTWFWAGCLCLKSLVQWFSATMFCCECISIRV